MQKIVHFRPLGIRQLHRAFTLIELMIVIAIIAILATIAILPITHTPKRRRYRSYYKYLLRINQTLKSVFTTVAGWITAPVARMGFRRIKPVVIPLNT